MRKRWLGWILFIGLGTGAWAVEPFGHEGHRPIASVSGGPRGEWRFTTLSLNSGEMAAGLRLRYPKALSTGCYVVRLSFRSKATSYATGMAYARLQAGPVDRTLPWTLDTPIQADGQWRDYFIPLKLPDPIAAGTFLIQLGVAHPGQTVDVKGLRLEALPGHLDAPLPPATGWTYPGRDPEAAWRVEARRRIDRLRRSEFSLTLRNSSGKPRSRETVEVELVRHAFPFGTAVKAKRLLGTDEDDLRYQAELRRNFHAAVLENDLKWPAVAGQWTDMPMNQTLRALERLRKDDFYVRGHCLLWGSRGHLPRPVLADFHDPEALQRSILAHIRSTAALTRGLVHEWDVVNEPRAHSQVYDRLGPGRAAAWFHAAREADPKARLFVNEFDLLNGRDLPSSNQRRFLDWLKGMLSAGAPIQAIGEQAHFWDPAVPSPEMIRRSLDLLAETALPVVITEYDINTSDEALQADFTRDFLMMAFSHPAVEGFYFWGFWEKAHWSPQGALFRADWSEKPALKAYRDLVFGEWSTRVRLVTDARGVATFRGFPGDYRLTVDGRNRESLVRWSRSQSAQIIMEP